MICIQKLGNKFVWRVYSKWLNCANLFHRLPTNFLMKLPGFQGGE